MLSRYNLHLEARHLIILLLFNDDIITFARKSICLKLRIIINKAETFHPLWVYALFFKANMPFDILGKFIFYILLLISFFSFRFNNDSTAARIHVYQSPF